jgi:hypothetical protein
LCMEFCLWGNCLEKEGRSGRRKIASVCVCVLDKGEKETERERYPRVLEFFEGKQR